ncbi:hypothetical protein SUGI_0099210 [Cryptomeria japonica]|uniref:large ribosomal subunit protein bL34c n=1 Tax=Cryptomeria japonica TaxID=3369 RepID=UPI002408CC07|nr:large ribosomal subunit protein bL34c [Cryptomeria japonica]GLJ08954.1 hypothetical protein SUGI_0099210 [Cryptomeria japonica]
MGIACLATFNGLPRASVNVISNTKFSICATFSPTRCAAASLSFSASSFAGVTLRPNLNRPRLVVERGSLLKVRAKKPAHGCTKRSRSRKSRARTYGFRIRMRSPGGRRVLQRRRAKGRKKLVTQTFPNTGKFS